MKKSIMQSTITVEGVYGVEIGDYAVVLSDGSVIRKPFPEEWEVVSDQNDGKISVDEFLLETAEMYNLNGEFLSDVLSEDEGNDTPITEGDGLFLGYSEQDEEESPPSDITLIATMKYGDILGWEFFPGMYLLENGRITSRIPEEEIELSEEEFSVPMMDYINAKDTANKLEIVRKSEELGQGGYID